MAQPRRQAASPVSQCVFRCVDGTLLHRREEKPSILFFFFFKPKGDAGIKESRIASPSFGSCLSLCVCCQTDQTLHVRLKKTKNKSEIMHASFYYVLCRLFLHTPRVKHTILASSRITTAGFASQLNSILESFLLYVCVCLLFFCCTVYQTSLLFNHAAVLFFFCCPSNRSQDVRNLTSASKMCHEPGTVFVCLPEKRGCHDDMTEWCHVRCSGWRWWSRLLGVVVVVVEWNAILCSLSMRQMRKQERKREARRSNVP